MTPCDCDTCTLTTLVVTKQSGRRKRRLEVTLDDENVNTLLAMLLRAQGFNSFKMKLMIKELRHRNQLEENDSD